MDTANGSHGCAGPSSDGTPDVGVPSDDRLYLKCNETRILGSLTKEPMTIEAIAQASGSGLVVTRSVLADLTEKGLARGDVGYGYSIATSTVAPRKAFSKHDVIADRYAVLCGDAEARLSLLPDGCADLFVFSSPYYKQRDYGCAGQIGWEPSPDAFATRIVGVLRQCARVARPHGLTFFNFDDYSDHQGGRACIDAKILARLEETGLELFREIIWNKTNSLPNGTDRGPRHVYEKLFAFRKKDEDHYWDYFAAREEAKGGGLRRLTDVWDLAPESGTDHIAPFPRQLVQRCIEIGVSDHYCSTCGKPWVRKIERGISTWKKNIEHGYYKHLPHLAANGKVNDHHIRNALGNVADMEMAEMRHLGWVPSCNHKGQPTKGLIIDPFCGSGKTGVVATDLGHDFLGIDLNPASVKKSTKAVRNAIEGKKLS